MPFPGDRMPALPPSASRPKAIERLELDPRLIDHLLHLVPDSSDVK